MGGSKYMVGWPAGRPDFAKKRPRSAAAGFRRRLAAVLFWKIRPAGWPANHVFGSTHPFLGYIIRIGISLDVFSSIFWPISLKQVPKIQECVFFWKKSSRQGCAATATCARVQYQIPHPKWCHRPYLLIGTPQTPFLIEKSIWVIQNGSKIHSKSKFPLYFP